MEGVGEEHGSPSLKTAQTADNADEWKQLTMATDFLHADC